MKQAMSLDFPAKLNLTAVRQAEERVQDILRQVFESKDPEIAARHLAQTSAIEHLTGLMRAELLYGLSRDWVKEGLRGPFREWASTRTGLGDVTIERYLRVGEMLADTDLPAVTRNQLKLRTVEELIPVATAWESGRLRPTAKQWEALLDAPDASGILGAVNKILGRAERSNALTIFWCADGTLEAWQNGQVESLGVIPHPPEDKSLRAKGVSKLLKGKVQVK